MEGPIRAKAYSAPPKLPLRIIVAGLVAILGNSSTTLAQGEQELIEGGSVLQKGSRERGVLTEGAEFLLLPVGARSFAMGGAVTALKGSGEAVIWNPAGVASLERKRLLFNHAENAFDTSTDILALIWPTKKLGTFGVTYYLVDFGNLDNTDDQGRVQGSINFRNQEFLLTYARNVLGGLDLGVNYKLIQVIFRCDGLCPEQKSFTRTTHALDLGILYERVMGLPIRLGGSVRHLGFPIQGDSQSDALPTRVRLGIGYEAVKAISADSPFALVLALDVQDRLRELGDPDVMLGSELSVAESFFLRAGYAFVEQAAGGPAIGVGIEYDWFYLDLSRGFDDISAATGEESVQVSFGVIF